MDWLYRRFHILRERRNIVHTVDGSGGGKYNLFAAVVSHNLAERKSSADVVIVVLKRLVAGFAYRLEACKMYDGVYFIFLKYGVKLLFVANVALIKLNLFPTISSTRSSALGLAL